MHMRMHMRMHERTRTHATSSLLTYTCFDFPPQDMLERMQKEYAAVSENCRQLERANAAMELQLERAKAQGAISSIAGASSSVSGLPAGVPY